jgi:DMSO/TMAO reductase YedYZ molybdopterin-dependent catalytic subunit
LQSGLDFSADLWLAGHGWIARRRFSLIPEAAMKERMRVMTERPLNAETPVAALQSWITPNRVFFDRNQGAVPPRRIPLSRWRLSVEGDIAAPRTFTFEEIRGLPRAIVADTLECSGNGRALLAEKSAGNPWTVGGVGNAVWGGVWLRDVLEKVGLKPTAAHVAFEGFDKPLGASGVKFIRSIPLEKALASTLLADEMNGEPLPLKHGYPLRALALGWTGANCVKWLNRITVMDRPYSGFFMDNVYRVFQKGQDPRSGERVTGIKLKSIITQPPPGETLAAGVVVVRGAAYAGEAAVTRVDVSLDGGTTWGAAQFIGPHESFAWRQWQYVWTNAVPGEFTLMARATDDRGRQQPMQSEWNVLGYGNNGVREHAVSIKVV